MRRKKTKGILNTLVWPFSDQNIYTKRLKMGNMLFMFIHTVDVDADEMAMMYRLWSE